MCAIIDNNVRHEVFGANNIRTEAGSFFFDWVNSSRGRIVIGGKLLKELSGYAAFNEWLDQALISGNALNFPDSIVNAETDSLLSQNICKSNDAHVLALARVCGARLLFTNDQDLQEDFKDPQIIGGIRGRVYTTLTRPDVRRSHRNLLRRTDLCNA